jgi:branched-chain amino acid transport system ATP-binding protein
MTGQSLLSVQSVTAGYGDATVLWDVGIEVHTGEIVAVVGANGAGKSTLLSTITGLLRPRSGRIVFGGTDITRRPAHLLPGDGLALVPEGGRLFPFMSVLENLQLGAFTRSARAQLGARLDEVMTLFPVLRDRREQMAGKLSGGERQMCAIARALMCHPTLLMLDEPSVGLSPLMVERVFDIVEHLARQQGLTIVLVEQNVTEALEVSDRAYVLDHGRIDRSGPAAALRADSEIRETYMGL